MNSFAWATWKSVYLELFLCSGASGLSTTLIATMADEGSRETYGEDSQAQTQVKAGSPNDFLKSMSDYIELLTVGVIGKRVAVRLNSGIDYHGMYVAYNF